SVVKGYQPRFEELLKGTYDLDYCDLTAYFDATQLPHDGGYAYGEKLAAKRGTTDTLSLGWRYANLADLLVKDKAPWEAGAAEDTPQGVVPQSTPHPPRAVLNWARIAVALVTIGFSIYGIYFQGYRYLQKRDALQAARSGQAKLMAGNPQGAVIDLTS